MLSLLRGSPIRFRFRMLPVYRGKRTQRHSWREGVLRRQPSEPQRSSCFLLSGRALCPALSLLCCSPPSVGQVTGRSHGFRVLAVFLRPSSLSVNGSSQPSAGPSTGALESGSQWEAHTRSQAFWLPQVPGLCSLPAYWWWVGHALGSSQGVSARTTEVSWGRRPFTVGKA